MAETFEIARWREAETITKATRDKDGDYEVCMGAGVFILHGKRGTEPKVGDSIRLAVYQGSCIGGVEINGKVVYHDSDQQIEADRQKAAKDYEAKRLAEFEKNEADYNVAFNDLPMPFQDRIARFRMKNPKFRVDYEGYELMVCVDAAKIGKALKTPDAISEFYKKSWEEQKAAVPGLDDGHSGNSFACACLLAKVYVEHPRLLKYMHGAITTLVGCESFGCHPLTPEEQADYEKIKAEAGL